MILHIFPNDFDRLCGVGENVVALSTRASFALGVATGKQALKLDAQLREIRSLFEM